MLAHKGGSESTRTTRRPARTPPTDPDVEAWKEHYGTLRAFTEGLKERRCRTTPHFREGLPDTVAAFKPLFAPWNMEVLFLLYMYGPERFNGLKRALGGVSSRVLTDKLRHLEGAGLLTRREDGEAVIYGLSDHGRRVARHLHPLMFYLHNRGDLEQVDA